MYLEALHIFVAKIRKLLKQRIFQIFVTSISIATI